MDTKDFDVIIVGRGPVGLFLACELRLQGLSVLIVERRNLTGTQGLDKAGETRACVLHGRTIEILEDRGLLDKFMDKGMRLPWWHYGVLETRLQFSAFGDETKQNCVLFAPQYKTEEIFENHALELGVVIRLGFHVEALEQTATTVRIYGTSTSTAGDQSPFVATGKYLVGADGWRSSVRTMAGFGYNHNAGTQTMLSVEARPAEPMPPAIITKNQAGLVIGCNLNVPSGRVRLVVWTPSRGHMPLSEPPTMEDFNQAMKEVTGKDWHLSDPVMLTRFSNESGCVTEYRKGRVLLAGDAGHRHLPAGGQGMNTGIQESYNLGWKLGAVARGEHPDSLLDTYESERLPVAQSVVDNTTAQSLLFFAHTRPEMAVREAMNRLLDIPEANRKLAKQISGFGYTYPTPLHMICPEGWEALSTNMTGERAVNFEFRVGNANGEERYLSDFMKKGKWVQLRFLDNGARTSTVALPAFGEWTEVVDVVDILEAEGLNISKYKSRFSEILIRPDGHFGFGKL
ncbi:putative monooxygenase [Ilyonectria robusta]|uniref:putative monooxygenase n=1 Tax=Ilyonectria robusta TaxID=1079257 RepID=UPI001E8DE284|nr:putative monooxygenase [Ilyonectria robusta]KAH8648838.1 putative monooxygenase [Ilyonectria robusta]